MSASPRVEARDQGMANTYSAMRIWKLNSVWQG